MDSNQLYHTIKLLQHKVSDLEAENKALREREQPCQLEQVLPLIQKPLHFKYTLEVLKNIRRYILEKRERYLSGLAQIQTYLLSFDAPETVFSKVLAIIGECSKATRVYLYENYFDADSIIGANPQYVWQNQNIQSNNNFDLITLNYQLSFSRWLDILSKGNFWAEEVANFSPSERHFFTNPNIVRILFLPLIVNGKFWGFLGLEHGGKQPLWENSEIILLESIVGAISLVLQRLEAQKNLENLNQKLETIVQERTAELEQKNRQLQQEIVKHEQTTTALQKAKEQLEAVLDAVPASISWISADLYYLGVNKNLADQVNLTPEDFINKPVGGPKSHHEFMNYLSYFFQSDLDKSTAEFSLGENTFLMVAKKYAQGLAAVLVGVDITDRRRAEDALNKSAALNQAILNAIPDSMFYLTENGTFLRCKIANEDELPFNCHHLLHQNIAQVLPPDLTHKFQEAISQTLMTQETQLIEFQLENSCGFLLDWEVRMALSHQDKVVAIWRNITEEKQAEFALKLSEEKFRATFEQAAVGLAHVDIEGNWLRVNEKICQIVGYSRSELLKINFQAITHPDDLEVDLNYFYQMLRGEISAYCLEKRYVHKQGFPVWINLTVSLVRSPSGEAKYFIAVVEDISGRKQTEKALKESSSRLKMALEAANMGTWEWNLVNKQQFWSAQSQVLFGFQKPNSPFTFQEFINCIHPEDREKIKQAITYSLENKSAYFEEYRIIKSPETINWIASQGDVFFDTEEQEIRIIGIDMDITERKKIEEEIRKSLVIN
jgi:PAS domain S-box-containing protein